MSAQAVTPPPVHANIDRLQHSQAMRKELDPPPPYSEADELLPPSFDPPPPFSPSIHRPIPRPITSGPVVYRGNLWLELIVYFYMFASFITKIIMAIAFKSVSCDSPTGCGKLSQNKCYYCHLILLASWLNALNSIWPHYCMKSDLHLSLKLRSPGKGIVFGLLDFTVSALIAFSSLGTTTDEYNNTLEYLTIPASVLFISSLLVMIVVCQYTIKAYSPYDPENEYVLSNRREEYLTPGLELSIIESGPLRIIFQNISNTPLHCCLRVERNVVTSYAGKNEKQLQNNITHFEFNLKKFKSLEPGETITLIPGAHKEEGSYRIKGFRSFGADKGEIIYTSFCNQEGRCLIRLTEEFKKDKFLAKQIALQTMSEEMRRQIFNTEN